MIVSFSRNLNANNISPRPWTGNTAVSSSDVSNKPSHSHAHQKLKLDAITGCKTFVFSTHLQLGHTKSLSSPLCHSFSSSQLLLSNLVPRYTFLWSNGAQSHVSTGQSCCNIVALGICTIFPDLDWIGVYDKSYTQERWYKSLRFSPLAQQHSLTSLQADLGMFTNHMDVYI